MGIAADFPTAFGKAQAAAGVSLPTEGTIFISVTDSDKPAATQLATRFHDLGFEVIATSGTAQAISAHGRARSARSTRSARARRNVVDCIRSEEVDLVINTPTGSGARTDGYEIRTAAVRHGIPCVTTMTGASAASRAIFAAARGDAEVIALQELHAAGGARAIEEMTAGATRGLGERVAAPFGRRLCEVTRNVPSGGYRIFSVLDPAGPEPAAGQFYMLAADSGWGGDEGRPYLARAFSVADAEQQSDWGEARLPGAGGRPRHRRLAALDPGRASGSTAHSGARSPRRPMSPPARPARSWSAAASASPPSRSGGAACSAPGSRPACCSASATARTPEDSTSSTAARSGWPARTATPATAAMSLTCSRSCWRATAPAAAPSTPAARRRCSRRCA